MALSKSPAVVRVVVAVTLYRWLLLAKLRLQSGDAEGYVAAQNQALKLQTMLLDVVRHPDKMGAAAAAAFDRLSGDGMGLRPKTMSFLTGDGSTAAARRTAMAPAAAATTTTAAGVKAATICFELAEHHRLRHQFDKVCCCSDCWRLLHLAVTACAEPHNATQSVPPL
jgi:hypothetical protein